MEELIMTKYVSALHPDVCSSTTTMKLYIISRWPKASRLVKNFRLLSQPDLKAKVTEFYARQDDSPLLI